MELTRVTVGAKEEEEDLFMNFFSRHFSARYYRENQKETIFFFCGRVLFAAVARDIYLVNPKLRQCETTTSLDRANTQTPRHTAHEGSCRRLYLLGHWPKRSLTLVVDI